MTHSALKDFQFHSRATEVSRSNAMIGNHWSHFVIEFPVAIAPSLALIEIGVSFEISP